MEIINKNKPVGGFDYAVLDFDGTISLIRQGWQDIMIPYFADELANTPEGLKKSGAENEEFAQEIVEINTGKQTIYQCIQLAEEIEKRGGSPLDPQGYKDEYHRRLLTRIDGRLKALADGSESPEDHVVPGAYALLNMLKRHGLQLYLASGTDEEYVLNEARLLKVDGYFDGHIYGAQTDYKSFSKKMVIERIIRENHIDGARLLGLGDGYVEIENIKEVGGFACGVASDEEKREGIDEWKRRRLITAGADIIISDYRDINTLENYLF